MAEEDKKDEQPEGEGKKSGSSGEKGEEEGGEEESYTSGGKNKPLVQGKYGGVNIKGGTGWRSDETAHEVEKDGDENSYYLLKKSQELSAAHAEAEAKLHFAKNQGIGSPMAPLAARISDATSHASMLSPGIGSPNVLIGGLPAWRQMIDIHMCPMMSGIIPHIGGVVTIGSPTVLINGAPACRQGDVVVEIPGGPNVIVAGCPTVSIGLPAPVVGLGGSELSLKLSGDVANRKYEGSIGGEFSSEEQTFGVKGSAMFALLKGTEEGKITIPLWGTHAITLKETGELTAGSLGGSLEATVGHDEDGANITLGAKLALIFGGGMKYSIGVK